jgi:hypothetical protein
VLYRQSADAFTILKQGGDVAHTIERSNTPASANAEEHVTICPEATAKDKKTQRADRL